MLFGRGITTTAVSLIVPYKGGIVLTRQRHDSRSEEWGLPMRYIRTGEETLEMAALIGLKMITGLITNLTDIELVHVHSMPKPHVPEHIINHAYRVIRYAGHLKIGMDVAAFKRLPDGMAVDDLEALYAYLRDKPQLENAHLYISSDACSMRDELEDRSPKHGKSSSKGQNSNAY